MTEGETQIERWVREMGPVKVVDSMFSKHERHRDVLISKMSKYDNIDVLYPTRGSGAHEGSFRPGYKHRPILFHESHDGEDVVQLWIVENSHMISSSSSWGIYQNMCAGRVSEDLLDSAKKVLKRKDPDGWVYNGEDG